MAASMDALRSWILISPLVPMCFFGLVLFVFASTIVLSLIPIYLPTRRLFVSLSITSSPQNILLRLSPDSNLLLETILDPPSQIIVQNQMQETLSDGVTGIIPTMVRVLNATGTTFSRRKRRQTSHIASGLIVIYELVFPKSCRGKCQTQMIISTRARFASLSITLNINTSTISNDVVTDNIEQISEYWANIRPYADNVPAVFGVVDTGLPNGCQVEQVQVLHRHSSRYPTSDPFDSGNIIRFAKKIGQIVATSGSSFTGPLSFLNTWSLRLGEELLVPSGAATEYQSGANFWNKYGRILYNAQPGQPYYSEIGRPKPLLRTTAVRRNYESTLAWAAGFFGPYNTTDKYSLLSIAYDNGSNNTLYGAFACRNLFVPSAATFNETNLYTYLAPALATATTRFSTYIPSNTNLTHIDAFTMQSLCAYEYAALGSSDFCSLFTLNEWRGFEQGLNLAFYNSYGFGNGTGRAQGIGYVQELIARLNKRLITVSYTSVNSTLDSSEETFPLNQPFYLDMSHDNNIASVLVALSIDYFRENLSPIYPPPFNQHYRVSRMTPFAARLVTEKIGCISPTPVAINSMRTQYSPSQYGYSSASATYKFIRMRLNNGILPLDTIRGGLCSVGRTDGLCPMENFLASQANASVMANFNYVCFGNYTLNANTIINDGTLFA